MILIKIYVTNSGIHGSGIFTKENIKVNSKIRRFDEAFEIVFLPEQLYSMQVGNINSLKCTVI